MSTISEERVNVNIRNVSQGGSDVTVDKKIFAKAIESINDSGVLQNLEDFLTPLEDTTRHSGEVALDIARNESTGHLGPFLFSGEINKNYENLMNLSNTTVEQLPAGISFFCKISREENSSPDNRVFKYNNAENLIFNDLLSLTKGSLISGIGNVSAKGNYLYLQEDHLDKEIDFVDILNEYKSNSTLNTSPVNVVRALTYFRINVFNVKLIVQQSSRDAAREVEDSDYFTVWFGAILENIFMPPVKPYNSFLSYYMFQVTRWQSELLKVSKSQLETIKKRQYVRRNADKTATWGTKEKALKAASQAISSDSDSVLRAQIVASKFINVTLYRTNADSKASIQLNLMTPGSDIEVSITLNVMYEFLLGLGSTKGQEAIKILRPKVFYDLCHARPDEVFRNNYLNSRITTRAAGYTSALEVKSTIFPAQQNAAEERKKLMETKSNIKVKTWSGKFHSHMFGGTPAEFSTLPPEDRNPFAKEILKLGVTENNSLVATQFLEHLDGFIIIKAASERWPINLNTAVFLRAVSTKNMVDVLAILKALEKSVKPMYVFGDTASPPDYIYNSDYDSYVAVSGNAMIDSSEMTEFICRNDCSTDSLFGINTETVTRYKQYKLVTELSTYQAVNTYTAGEALKKRTQKNAKKKKGKNNNNND